MKRAVITGVTGQDGSLLAKMLLGMDYIVYGVDRRTSSPTDWRLSELGINNNPKFHVVSGDITDYASMQRIMSIAQPDEVYNLAAQSFVGASWDIPLSTHDITGLGAIRVFEAARAQEKIQDRQIRVYQASSSEMFGGERKTHFMDESEPFHPRSPYGVAKCCAHMQARVNRESFGQFISCGILFNHESEYRGIEFVTRKITDAVARIYLEMENSVALGTLDSARDWGYAGDYIQAMWLMLQHHEPDDFVIATGEVHTIEDLVRTAFAVVEIEKWQDHVTTNLDFARPADVRHLRGNAEKALISLGWRPRTTFEQMIELMVHADIRRLEKGEEKCR